MKKLLNVSMLILIAAAGATAQMSPTDVLDRLTGDWVMEGTIAKQHTIHDVRADWVLNREYIRFHEISRDKKPSGEPAYEAIVFFSWDVKPGRFTCMWLDSTEGGGLSAEGLAHGEPAGLSIPLVFTTSRTDAIHTTFTYSRVSDSWSLTIDNVSNGKVSPFANLKLTRKEDIKIIAPIPD